MKEIFKEREGEREVGVGGGWKDTPANKNPG